MQSCIACLRVCVLACLDAVGVCSVGMFVELICCPRKDDKVPEEGRVLRSKQYLKTASFYDFLSTILSTGRESTMEIASRIARDFVAGCSFWTCGLC